MKDGLFFGSYIRAKRLEKHITALDLARALGIGNPYWCDIEKGNRNPPDFEKLEKLAALLELTPEEKGVMMDLAGSYREQAAPDLSAWILATPGLSTALRTARDMDVSPDEWLEMVEEMKCRKGL